MTASEYTTRFELCRALAEVEGRLSIQTIELLADATAIDRHQRRVAAALDAAMAAANHDPALAWAVLAADSVGVGGRFDCDGTGTARIPALEGRGTGRKRASDGDAWSAAVQEASASLSVLARFAPSEEGTLQVLFWALHVPEESPPVVREVPLSLAPLRWQKAIATSRLLSEAETKPLKEADLVGWGRLRDRLLELGRQESARFEEAATASAADPTD